MLDKRKLHEDLLEQFILYQYRLENPMPSAGESERAIEQYRKDQIFYRKVNSLVSGVMLTIDRHL